MFSSRRKSRGPRCISCGRALARDRSVCNNCGYIESQASQESLDLIPSQSQSARIFKRKSFLSQEFRSSPQKLSKIHVSRGRPYSHFGTVLSDASDIMKVMRLLLKETERKIKHNNIFANKLAPKVNSLFEMYFDALKKEKLDITDSFRTYGQGKFLVKPFPNVLCTIVSLSAVLLDLPLAYHDIIDLYKNARLPLIDWPKYIPDNLQNKLSKHITAKLKQGFSLSEDTFMAHTKQLHVFLSKSIPDDYSVEPCEAYLLKERCFKIGIRVLSRIRHHFKDSLLLEVLPVFAILLVVCDNLTRFHLTLHFISRLLVTSISTVIEFRVPEEVNFPCVSFFGEKGIPWNKDEAVRLANENDSTYYFKFLDRTILFDTELDASIKTLLETDTFFQQQFKPKENALIFSKKLEAFLDEGEEERILQTSAAIENDLPRLIAINMKYATAILARTTSSFKDKEGNFKVSSKDLFLINMFGQALGLNKATYVQLLWIPRTNICGDELILKGCQNLFSFLNN